MPYNSFYSVTFLLNCTNVHCPKIICIGNWALVCQIISENWFKCKQPDTMNDDGRQSQRRLLRFIYRSIDNHWKLVIMSFCWEDWKWLMIDDCRTIVITDHSADWLLKMTMIGICTLLFNSQRKTVVNNYN